MKATDWDKDHVDLAWQPPENNGGAPIEKYIIEKKDKFGDWVVAAEVKNCTDFMTFCQPLIVLKQF